MQNRVAGDDSAADDLRRAAVRDLGSGVATLFSVALGMLPAGIRESEEFSFLGTPVTLAKDNDGMLSTIVGQGAAKTTLRLGFDVDTLVGRLVGRAVRDQDTIGTAAVTDILFDNFNAVQKAVGVDGLAIYNDARGVVTNELHVKVGFFDGDLVVDTIKADARHEGGDKSYAIDIGV